MEDDPCSLGQPLTSWQYCCQNHNMKSASAFETWVRWTPWTSRAAEHVAAVVNSMLDRHRPEQTVPGTVWIGSPCTVPACVNANITWFSMNKYSVKQSYWRIYNVQQDSDRHFKNNTVRECYLECWKFLILENLYFVCGLRMKAIVFLHYIFKCNIISTFNCCFIDAIVTYFWRHKQWIQRRGELDGDVWSQWGRWLTQATK